MKKYNMILSLLMLFLLSCSDKYEDSESNLEGSEKEVMFSINLEMEPLSITTRGFFDDTAETKPWEMELNTLFLSIHMDNENNNVLKQYTFTRAEIESGKILVSVPEAYINKQVRFLAYANYVNIPSFSVPWTIFSKKSGSINTYSGTYNDVAINGIVPKGGFEMAGTILMTCPTAKEIVPVTIHLERLVNKFAIKTFIGDDFRERYHGGDLKVLNVKLNNVNSISYLLRQNDIAVGSTSLNQDAVYNEGYYNNLFYLFESDNQIEITLDCLFDKDGDFSKTNDQERFTYKFYTSIGSVNTGRRNDYHRLSITIHTLPNNISPHFTLDEEWSTIIDNELEYDEFINFIDN